MSLKHTAFALAAGLLLAASAQAQVGITADLGTTGVGAHLVVPMESNVNGRFGLNYFQHDFTKHSGAVAYDVKGKLQTFDLLLDWYPRADSVFRLTGGVIYNNSKFDAKTKANNQGIYTLNGARYNATDVGILTGKVDFRKAAPYLGIGWGNALAASKRWSFNADLGAFYQGKANISSASSGCTTLNAICGALAKDVAVERAKLADDAASFKVYPVLRGSVAYRF